MVAPTAVTRVGGQVRALVTTARLVSGTDALARHALGLATAVDIAGATVFGSRGQIHAIGSTDGAPRGAGALTVATTKSRRADEVAGTTVGGMSEQIHAATIAKRCARRTLPRAHSLAAFVPERTDRTTGTAVGWTGPNIHASPPAGSETHRADPPPSPSAAGRSDIGAASAAAPKPGAPTPRRAPPGAPNTADCPSPANGNPTVSSSHALQPA